MRKSPMGKAAAYLDAHPWKQSFISTVSPELLGERCIGFEINRGETSNVSSLPA